MLLEYSKLVQTFWITDILSTKGDTLWPCNLSPRYISSRKSSGLKQQSLSILQLVGQAGHIGLFKMVETQKCKSNSANASQAFDYATPINSNGQKIQGGTKNWGYQ